MGYRLWEWGVGEDVRRYEQDMLYTYMQKMNANHSKENGHTDYKPHGKWNAGGIKRYIKVGVSSFPK